MNSFYEMQSANIIKKNEFIAISNKLFKAYVEKMIGGELYELTLSELDIIKLIKTIQIFHKSERADFIKEGAELLSMLLDVAGEHYEGLTSFANYIFCENGNFPNMELIRKRYPRSNTRYNFFDELNINTRRELNTINEISKTLTDYQRQLWEDLVSTDDVLTSAPTSTGKTYLILKYLVNSIVNSGGAFAAIVVPTRALISEISNNIYEILKDYDNIDDVGIVTVPQKENVTYKDKTFFVMTQERLFELLQFGGVSFNYLFIDEAHNISSERGVLLHLTLQELLDNSTPKIIISMPSEEYKNSYDSVLADIKLKKKITNDSSVAKILISIEFSDKSINLGRLNKSDLYVMEKQFNGKNIEDIILLYGKNESNIIFRNGKSACEKIADKLSNVLPQINDNAINEAADYIEKFLHKDFSLAKNLTHGVAFHYGALPSTTRILIENLMRDGKISFLACTSTLAEGINLPAKNLFLENPKLDKIPLDNVQIKNVIGRAGRMLQHFAGNVFLIDPKKWDNDYDLDDSSIKEDKIPTFFSLLNTDVHGIIATLKGGKPENDTYYSIANKLINEHAKETLLKTLEAKELILSIKSKNQLIKAIEDAELGLQVEPFIVHANPTIGYIQQNRLYAFLFTQNDLTEWMLPYPTDPNVYGRLVKILLALSDVDILSLSEGNAKRLATIAIQWLQGKHLRDIIDNQVKHYKTKNVNTCIREAIKAIDTDIRFRMANALKCYYTIITSLILSKGLTISSSKIYAYIEVGGYKERFINLSSLGLSRDTSIEIDRILKARVCK